MLTLGILVWLLASAEPGAQPAPLLRQSGAASGHTDHISRELLCERAEDSAWRLVWKSCREPHRVDRVETSGCATVDYRPARDDGRGPFLEVRVQVEYDCLPPA